MHDAVLSCLGGHLTTTALRPPADFQAGCDGKSAQRGFQYAERWKKCASAAECNVQPRLITLSLSLSLPHKHTHTLASVLAYKLLAKNKPILQREIIILDKK